MTTPCVNCQSDRVAPGFHLCVSCLSYPSVVAEYGDKPAAFTETDRNYLDGSLVRHARGAWGNRTHTFAGSIVLHGERIAFYATRDFDRDAARPLRTSYSVDLNRPGSNKHLTAAKWEEGRTAVRKAFKRALDAANAEIDAMPVAAPAVVVPAARPIRGATVVPVRPSDPLRRALVAEGRTFAARLDSIIDIGAGDAFTAALREWENCLADFRARLGWYWEGRQAIRKAAKQGCQCPDCTC